MRVRGVLVLGDHQCRSVSIWRFLSTEYVVHDCLFFLSRSYQDGVFVDRNNDAVAWTRDDNNGQRHWTIDKGPWDPLGQISSCISG
jgi:hypothetical protein